MKDNNYARGSFAVGAHMGVQFTESSSSLSGTPGFSDLEYATTTGNYEKPAGTATTVKNTSYNIIGEDNASNAPPSATTWYMVPNDGTIVKEANSENKYAANDGFEVVMSFKLIAEDTGETILVKDARAFVPAEYTKWSPNTLYKYIFKITQKTGGTTNPTPDPDPEPKDPEDGGALYPIVFDKLTISEPETGTTGSEYEVTPGNNANPAASGS